MKILNSEFSKWEIKMGKKCLKVCSSSLGILEMQIKTTLRFHLTPVWMGMITKTTDNDFWRGCEDKGPTFTLGRITNLSFTLEVSVENHQKGENKSTIWPTQLQHFLAYAQRIQPPTPHICPSVLAATLLTIAWKWKLPKHPLMMSGYWKWGAYPLWDTAQL